ncbi:hypothetical protein RsS62_23240 [Rhizobium dioscoreae]|nr:hypothetical protein RsS62_23240 [Rhizobium dioscoreae]
MKNPSPFTTRGRHGDRIVKTGKRQDGFVQPERSGTGGFGASAFHKEPADASFAGGAAMASNKKAPTLILSKGEGWGWE